MSQAYSYRNDRITELIIACIITVILTLVAREEFDALQQRTINQQTEALLYVPKCRSPYTGVSSCSTQSKTGQWQYLLAL